MCLAIPVEIVAVLPDQQAVVDLAGVRKQICTALLDSVAVGDYVILHVGYAIGKLDAEEARRTLEFFGELALTEGMQQLAGQLPDDQVSQMGGAQR